MTMHSIGDRPSHPDGGRADAGEDPHPKVGIMGADRPCTGCAYNLVGQPIVRDSVYGILLVRCPECGTATGLLEYPLLGRSARLWAMLLAAVWLLVLLGMLLGFATVLGSLAFVHGDLAAGAMQTTARTEYQEWWSQRQMELAASAAGGDATGQAATQLPIPSIWQQSASQNQASIQEWLATHGGEDAWSAAWIAERGGLWRATGLRNSPPALIAGVLGVVFGIVWSVAALGVPRRRLWIVALVQVTAAVLAMMVMNSFENAARESAAATVSWYAPLAWGTTVSLRLMGNGAVLVLTSILFLLGLFFGRSIARWLVCVLLPPRLRWGLVVLWTADGLKPPPAT